ncbi:uncharacterized protein LOC116609559 [Nematostella vectensis]|uniref:uncharacterized protein LOC116609559 n=1 Tax=Nematostella vectensis TaxID=45351 RepID=UPI0013904718|nr:uncharacterized protein LOC116609559 [Nematostella vectensis]
MSEKTEYILNSRYSCKKNINYFFFSYPGFPSGAFAETVRKHANALINTNGGILVFGVNPNSEFISGIKRITRAEEDLYRLSLDREIRNFKPSVSPSLYRFSIRFLSNSLCLLEIRISAGPVGEMYMTGDEKVYIVKHHHLHGPLYPFEIKELVLAKYKAEIKHSQGVITPALY